ncbi:MAG: bifunctional [glutamate--ammonia ligase]-adenylyl-L-tyrosine phosphorylase/[glutamate--ammonia-ligase] adenylyltransferase [Janthinobacterium lividum]
MPETPAAQQAALSLPAGAANPALVCATFSRYAQRLLSAAPSLHAYVAGAAGVPVTRARMSARLDELLAAQSPTAPAAGNGSGEASLMTALRQLRNEVFCVVMERDLSGLAELEEVVEAMSDLAELSIARAVTELQGGLQAQYGAPLSPGRGDALSLGVVGMGKLGGRELNVSSDIDLVFVYEEDGSTAGGTRGTLSNHEYFTRLGRKLIGMLSERTADGYVFRVDMRLRPNGDSGPLVCPLAMLEEYFYAQGREWERYAWIKGRLLSLTDDGAGLPPDVLAPQLESLVRPFVYRRYLDFGVIEALRSLHVQIGQEALRRATMRPEIADDIKLGRGGIREIEFIAQVFQLIRGGQDAGLRVRPTRVALDRSAVLGLIDIKTVERLRDSYRFLRRLEHRLQYLDDAQTHAMPVDAGDRQRLALAMGFDDYTALYASLSAHRDFVEAQFDRIFADKDGQEGVADAQTGDAARQDEAAFLALWRDAFGSADDAQQSVGDALEGGRALLAQWLDTQGFVDSDDALERLMALRRSGRYAQLPEASRIRLDSLMARAVARLRSFEPATVRATTLSRFVDLIEAISRRKAYLSLLGEYPAALGRVLRVLSNSRWAAGYLLQHPQLLDELLDDDAQAAPFDWPGFRGMLSARLAAADGVEQRMDMLRHAHHAEVFRILLADLSGKLTVEQVSDCLSDLADAVLEVTLHAVWQGLPRRHEEALRFAIIAYGKLGGKELGYASDLDLIFLYDESPDGGGDADDTYARFARRLISWLTTATGAGTLFDVDLRLRPSGAAGLLVTPLKAFRRYQMREQGDANTAWVWEHQALTRARFCAGDPAIGSAFEEIRREVITVPRDAALLAKEIVSMRQRVHEGHPNRSVDFDLKHDRGGMVDIEFIVQYLVLGHASRYPELVADIGNIGLLRALAALGVVTADEAATVGDAYRQYRALQHRLRLDGMEAARVPPERVSQYRDAVLALWTRMFGNDAAVTAA